MLFKTVFAGFFFFLKQSQICKYFYFALSFMNVALVDPQVFPGKEASCTYEIAVFKLRNQRKKKGNRGVILEINDRSQDTKTQKP